MRFRLGVTALVCMIAQPADAERKIRRAPAGRPEQASLRGGAAVASRSPDGRHFFELANGIVLLDGLALRREANAELVGTPSWRADCDAIAWIERAAGQIRLVVMPALRQAPTEALSWVLPSAMAQEAIHWSSASRVAIGPSALAPRAVASWIEELASSQLVDTSKD